MSLGDNYSNNKNTKYSPTVYSRVQFGNSQSSLDPTYLSVRYWKNLMCVQISPRKNTGNDDVEYDYENSISIYLNMTKAIMLSDILKKFKENPKEYNQSGVNSNNKIILIDDGSNYNVQSPVITISSVNNETGEIEASYAYEFKSDFYFGLKNYNSGNYDKISFRNVELDKFIIALDEYVKSQSMAMAYSVYMQSYYNGNAVTTMKDQVSAIAKKLGVSVENGKYTGNSYFNKNNNNSNSNITNDETTSMSIDDIISDNDMSF